MAGLIAARSLLVRAIKASMPKEVARWFSFPSATAMLRGYLRAFFPTGSAPPRCIHWTRNFTEFFSMGSAPNVDGGSGEFPKFGVIFFLRCFFGGGSSCLAR